MSSLAGPVRSFTPDCPLVQLESSKSTSALAPTYLIPIPQSNIQLKTSFAISSNFHTTARPQHFLCSRKEHCLALRENKSHQLDVNPQASEQKSWSPSDLPLFICDGQPTETVPASAAAFLRLFPSCPYTTTRTWGHQRKLLFWESHLRRLSQSAQEMQRAGKWGAADFDIHSAQLRIAIERSLTVALQQAVSQEHATELSVTILLLPHSGERGMLSANVKRSVRNTSKARTIDESFAEGKHTRANTGHIKDEKRRAAREESMQAETKAPAAEQMSNDLVGEAGVSACVYISSYEAPEKGQMPDAIAAAIMGPGRTLPLAKDSSWALERRPLEGSKPPGVSEVLLSKDGEALLEGMLTNLFVLRKCGDTENRAFEKGVEEKSNGEASKAGNDVFHSGDLAKGSMAQAIEEFKGHEGMVDAPETMVGESEEAVNEWSYKGLVLQTASLEDGVLPGVVRHEVLRLCEQWGVSVILSAPQLAERSDWLEAFVTSSVRIVQPVSSVRWRPTWRPVADVDGRHVAKSDWLEHSLPTEHPFCRALWGALLDEGRLQLSSLDIASLLQGPQTQA